MNLAEALAYNETINPESAWLTHISHYMWLSCYQ